MMKCDWENETVQQQTEQREIVESIDIYKHESYESGQKTGATTVRNFSYENKDGNVVPETPGLLLSRSGRSIHLKPTQIIYQTPDVAVVRSGYSEPEETIPENVSAAGKKQKNADKIICYLYKSWKSSKMCDLVMVLGKSKYTLHKIVLAAHSMRFHHAFADSDSQAVTEVELEPSTSAEGLMAVINFMYTSDIKISASNIDGVLGCALQLQVSDIVEQCKEFLSHFTITSVLPYIYVAEKHSLRNLLDTMSAFVREKFTDVVATKQFLDCPYERVAQLLADDNLNVDNEIEVFHAATRWLDHNRQARMAKAVSLISKVRLLLISPEDLAMSVEVAEHIMAIAECKEMVWQAYRYSLSLPSTQTFANSGVQNVAIFY